MSDLHTKLTRREILRLAAMGAGGAMLAACGRAVEPITRALATPTSAPHQIATNIPITANKDFFNLSIRGTPQVPADWKLAITGHVDTPLALTLDEIRAMPAVTEMRTLACISNPVGGDLIGNAMWKGIRVSDLLARAGIPSNARHLKLESFDGFSTGIPLDLGMDKDSLLVYEMNGAPLPPDNGAPLRGLFPGRFGMKQPKWIRTITVVDEEYAGFWEKQGWSNDAYLLPFSRIDTPKDSATMTGATFTLSGIAFSGDDGLARLDVSWDDTKQWLAAQITRASSPLVWSVWQWTGNALPPGRHTLYARATDARGKTQTRAQAFNIMETFPNGVDQMHSIVLDFKP